MGLQRQRELSVSSRPLRLFSEPTCGERFPGRFWTTKIFFVNRVQQRASESLPFQLTHCNLKIIHWRLLQCMDAVSEQSFAEPGTIARFRVTCVHYPSPFGSFLGVLQAVVLQTGRKVQASSSCKCLYRSCHFSTRSILILCSGPAFEHDVQE